MEKNLVVLLIEDNDLNRNMLKRRFSKRGLTTILAEDGNTGIKKAQEENPDCILLDITLPDMPGEEVAKYLAHDKRTNNIPIIALTAIDKKNAVELVETGNFIDYCLKPFDFPDLIRKIQQYAGG